MTNLRKRAVWLDCDTGHDDAFALFLAVHDPDIDLLGVSTCFGNSTLPNTTQNTAQCLEGFKAPEKVQVFPGAETGLFKAYHKGADNIHGASGLAGVEGLPKLDSSGVRKRIQNAKTANAVDGMRQAASSCLAAGRKLTICCTGPITNFAIFLLAHEHLANDTIDEVLFMGGALEELGNSNHLRSAEWNVFCDPHALDIVLKRCRIPLRLFPLDITHKAILRTAQEVPRFKQKQSNIRHILTTIAEYFRTSYDSVFDFKEGPPIHDLLTIAYMTRPAIFDGKMTTVSVVLDGEHTGKIARAQSEEECNNVWVADSVDVDQLWNLFFNALDVAESL